MTVQISAALADAMLNAIPASMGPSCRFQVWTSAPVDPVLEPAGVLLVDMALPVSWLGTASAGVAAKVGTWSGVAITDGVAASYRFTTAGGDGFSTGTLGVAGQGADAEIDTTTIVMGQTLAVTAFDFKFPGFGA